MAYVIVDPGLMTAAASDLATLGSDLTAAHLDAAARTTSVIPAAADEVSAAIADLMSTHGLDFQKVAQSASTFHQEFINNVNAAAAAYSSTEAASAASTAPTLISLPEFFQIVATDFQTATTNFANSLGRFPNLAWDQLGRAIQDLVVAALFPVSYPVFAITIYVFQAAIYGIFNPS